MKPWENEKFGKDFNKRAIKYMHNDKYFGEEGDALEEEMFDENDDDFIDNSSKLTVVTSNWLIVLPMNVKFYMGSYLYQ